jgi:hypothetical protein
METSARRVSPGSDRFYALHLELKHAAIPNFLHHAHYHRVTRVEACEDKKALVESGRVIYLLIYSRGWAILFESSWVDN